MSRTNKYLILRNIKYLNYKKALYKIHFREVYIYI